jgi:hypothetical protein
VTASVGLPRRSGPGGRKGHLQVAEDDVGRSEERAGSAEQAIRSASREFRRAAMKPDIAHGDDLHRLITSE